MNSLFVKIPTWVQHFFHKQLWSIPTDKKEIYLTFDDGPTPKITEWVLNQLAEYNAKATFFCIGKNIADHPQILEKTIAQKHRIGNHTYNHLQGWKTKTVAYMNDVLKTEKLLNQKNLPNTHKIFRPPYGKIKSSQLKKVLAQGYKVVMWDVLSADYNKKISKEQCLNNVIKNTKPGSIVVFHDSIKASKHLEYVLPKVLEHFSKKGFLFKAIC